MTILNRTELKEYVYRKLGDGFHTINVSDQQAEERIDEALKFLQEFHEKFTVRTLLKHEITQQDIDNEYIEVPEEILFFRRVIPLTRADLGSQTRTFHEQFNQIHSVGNVATGGFYQGSLQTHFMAQMYQGLLRSLNPHNQIYAQFSRLEGFLFLRLDWKKAFAPGDFVILDCERAVDVDQYYKALNDRYFIELVTEMIRFQWGENLSKFDGIDMIGGANIDGEKMKSQAQQNIEKVQEKIIANTAPFAAFIMR